MSVYDNNRDLMVNAMLGMTKRVQTRDAQDVHYAVGYLSGAVAAWVALQGSDASDDFLKYIAAQATASRDD
jgi:hypothetical protein